MGWLGKSYLAAETLEKKERKEGKEEVEERLTLHSPGEKRVTWFYFLFIYIYFLLFFSFFFYSFIYSQAPIGDTQI